MRYFWFQRGEPWPIWAMALAFVVVFVVTAVASLALVTVVIIQMPETYLHEVPAAPPGSGLRHRLIQIARNLLGVVLIVIGIFLSLPGVPGQGLLTVLIGLVVVDFPGKHRFVRKLAARHGILDAINHLRSRFGRPPLTMDPAPRKATQDEGRTSG